MKGNARLSALTGLGFFLLVSQITLSSVNLPTGGFTRFPAAKEMDCVGHTSMQAPQAKQSGITRSLFSIASITVEGQALAQASQETQVS